MTDEETYTVKLSTIAHHRGARASRKSADRYRDRLEQILGHEWCTVSHSAVSFERKAMSSRRQNSINEERSPAWSAGAARSDASSQQLRGRSLRAGLRAPTMPRDFNTKSIFVGEIHGRVTPRVEELPPVRAGSTRYRPRRTSGACAGRSYASTACATASAPRPAWAETSVTRIPSPPGCQSVSAAEAIKVGQALGYDS